MSRLLAAEVRGFFSAFFRFAVFAFEFESVITSHSEVRDFVVSICCYGRRWFLDTIATMIPGTSTLRKPIAARSSLL